MTNRPFHRSMSLKVTIILAALIFAASLNAAPISPGKRYPSNEEQFTLQLINQARTSADGLTILGTLVTNNLGAITPSSKRDSQNGTPWSTNFWKSSVPDIAYAMNFFRIHPGDLKKQYMELVIPNSPLAWDANLGNVASGYNDLVIASEGEGAGFPHNLPPYEDNSTFAAFAKRNTDGGYGPLNDISYLAENVAQNNYVSARSRFMALMIDWGYTADGIQDQNPDFGSHRLNMMDAGFAELGDSAKPGWDSTAVTEVQEFGKRFSIPPQLVGAVYFDTDQDGFYTSGEGLGGVQIKATPVSGGTVRTTVTQRNGGYALPISTAGIYTITAVGGFGTKNAGSVTISSKNVLLNITTPRGQEIYDFNRDDKPDLFVLNSSTQQTSIWYLNGGEKIGESTGPSYAFYQTGWGLAGIADFNSDGQPDLVLYNSDTKQTVIWYLNGSTKVGRADGPSLADGWLIAGIEDFNRDGHPDYLLWQPATRKTVVWYLDGPSKVGSSAGPDLPTPDIAWRVVGIADVNGDGKPDLSLYNTNTRKTAIWYLDDNLKTGGNYGPTLETTPTGWTVAGVADFNADNHPDYLLYNTATRKTVIWYLNGITKFARADGPTLPQGWNLLTR